MESKTALKNKVNNGHFICNRCQCEVGVGFMIKGYNYCKKCYEILKGIRNERGRKI